MNLIMNMRTILVTWVYIFAMSRAKANQCGRNCELCTSINGVLRCTKCNDGYRLSNSTCQPCSLNCDTCFNELSCETCKPGFYSPNYMCNSQCSVNCVDGLCDENTGHCNQCPSNRYGYFCDFDCGLCKNEQCELRHCTGGCKDGYWQQQSQNISECKPCMANCSSCDDGSACIVCNDGTYLYTINDDRAVCVTCAPYCEKCSSLTSCSSCKQGYFGYTCKHSCSTHISYCYLCDWNGTANVTCSQCDNGYTLRDNKCIHNLQQCPLNCERCTSSNVCELCKTGWYGELCNKSCRNISNCMSCQKMNDTVLCTVCVEGYTIMNGECMETTTKPTSTAMTDCSDIPNCSSCNKVNNFIVCSVCVEGYKLMNGECRKITSQQTTSTSTPLTTKIDFNDVKDCATCSEANCFISCSECVEGYTTTDGSSSVDVCGRCALQSSASFQASSFAIGLVTGFGIAVIVMTLIGLVCYWIRRKCFQQGSQSTFRSQDHPFYENRLAANESGIEHESYGGISQENSQQLEIFESHSSTVYEGMDPAPCSNESASRSQSQTPTDKDQHEYSSLGASQGEHIYKDLNAL